MTNQKSIHLYNLVPIEKTITAVLTSATSVGKVDAAKVLTLLKDEDALEATAKAIFEAKISFDVETNSAAQKYIDAQAKFDDKMEEIVDNLTACYEANKEN